MYGKGQNPNSLLSQLDKALEAGDESFNMSGGAAGKGFFAGRKSGWKYCKNSFAEKNNRYYKLL